MNSSEEQTPATQPTFDGRWTILGSIVTLIASWCLIAWQHGPGLLMVMIPLSGLWFLLSMILLSRAIHAPKFARSTDDGLPVIVDKQVVVPKLVWSERWAMALLVSAAFSMIAAMVLQGNGATTLPSENPAGAAILESK